MIELPRLLTAELEKAVHPYHAAARAPPSQGVMKRVDWFRESEIDGALIPQSAFLYQADVPEAMCQQLGRLT